MVEGSELSELLDASVRALLNARSCSAVRPGSRYDPCESSDAPSPASEAEDELRWALSEAPHSAAASSRGDAWDSAGHDPRYRHVAELQAQEEFRLVAMAKAGDSFSAEKLVLHHLPLLRSVARRYLHCGLSRGELVDEGTFGIVRAVERFDQARGVRFATYARWWIRDAMRTALLAQARLIRLPAYARQARARNASREGVDQAVDRSAFAYPCVIDCGDLELEEQVPDQHTPDSTLQNKQQAHVLREAMERLDDREREVLDARFGLQSDEAVTLSALALRLGVSCERVRQIQNGALQKLRRCIESGAGHG